MTIVTGSGGDRFMNCRGSSVFSRSFDHTSGEDATRGREAHAYLERILDGVERETAVDLIDARWRESIAEIDLRSVRDLTGLAPEVSLAYHAPTDTARVLGRALDRDYDGAGVRDDEIPMTIDIIGVGPDRGFNGDWKTGYQSLPPVRRNWQMKLGALAVARAFGRDEMESQLIFAREGKPVRRDREVFDAADLAVMAGEVAARWDQTLEDRRDFYERGIMPDTSKGSWCKYCPSRHLCPAQHALIQAAIGHAESANIARQVSVMTPVQLGEAYRKLKLLEPAIKELKDAIFARASFDPIPIGTEADGTELWLGETEKLGNRELDPDITEQVLLEVFPEDPGIVADVFKREVAIGVLEQAIRDRMPRGMKQPRVDRVFKTIKDKGGEHRPVKPTVGLYKIPPDRAAQRPGGPLRLVPAADDDDVASSA